LRAKLAIARFFSDSQDLITFIGENFTNRVANGQAIGDIADVYGKTVDEDKILITAQKVLENQGASPELSATIE
jgi:hypothetical protein